MAIEKIANIKIKSYKDLMCWWNKDRKNVANKFDDLYKRWREETRKDNKVILFKKKVIDLKNLIIKDEIEETKLGKIHNTILSLGIDVLPLLIERIKEGDFTLLPLVGELTDNKGVTFIGSRKDKIEFTINWLEKNKKNWIIPE